MGTVWLAEDEEDAGRRVALKLFHPELPDREGFFARFAREAEAGSRVEHPNVVRTFGAEMQVQDGRRCFFLVMEHVEGRSLRDVLDDLGQVPETLAREIARQVATGLAAIHAAGLVHRDVKPENVLLTPDHVVRIADLGVAKVLDATRALTQEGQFAGSLAYAAPEQFRGGDVTGAADLYALGVLLHEILSGENPFLRESGGAVVRAHLDEEAPDVTDRAPETTAFAAEVVRTLLAKDPARRFASAADLAGVLEAGERSAWWREHEDDALRRRARIPRVPVRRETTLRGREGDLALLRDAWAEARAGRGGTVLLTGEAGIGKSRLVDALLSESRSETAHFLYGSHPPFGGAAVAESIVARLGAEGLERKVGELLHATPLLAPPLAAWLRREPPPQGALSLEGDVLHAALVRLMRALAAEKPVLWVLEDLHFADAEQRKLALSLARAVEGHPVLLLLTSRPELPAEDLARFDSLANLRRAGLERLGAREVILLVRDAFRSEHLADKLGARIALASDGNPFFVFEMIRGLKLGQFVTELPDGTWVDTKAIDRIPVPDSVRKLIEARLRDLPREVRELLDVGAVLGYEFDPDVVAAVARRTRLDVLRDLAHAERACGVVRAAGRSYRFDHHQVQEAVYADLSQPLREELHAAVAEAIEGLCGAAEKAPDELDGALCATLVEHLLNGGRGAAALRYADAALRHLAATAHCEQFIRTSTRLMALPQLVPGADRLRVALLSSCIYAGLARSDARSVCEEALALAQSYGTPEERGKAARQLARCHLSSGRPEDAVALVERAESFAPSPWNQVELANALTISGRLQEARALFERMPTPSSELEFARDLGLGGVALVQGRFTDALVACERAFVRSEASPWTAQRAAAAINLAGALTSLGRLAEAMTWADRGVDLARRCGNRDYEINAQINLASCRFYQGQVSTSYSGFGHALRLAQELGAPQAEGVVHCSLGRAAQAMGRLALAWSHGERSFSLARAVGDRATEASARCLLGELASSGGDPSGASASTSEGLSIARGAGAPSVEAVALQALGAAASAAGDDATAIVRYDEALAVARAVGDPMGVVDALAELGDHWRRTGDPGRARSAIEEALSIARPLVLTPRVALCLALLACVTGDGASAAEASMAESGEGGDTVRVRFLLWQATHDRAHLAEAKRLLDFLVEHAPPESRGAMLTNVRLHREIVAAANEAGLGTGDAPTARPDGRP